MTRLRLLAVMTLYRISDRIWQPHLPSDPICRRSTRAAVLHRASRGIACRRCAVDRRVSRYLRQAGLE